MRVNSAYGLRAFGFQLVGVGLTGLSIEHFGAASTVQLCSIAVFALGAITVASHHLRHALPLAETQSRSAQMIPHTTGFLLRFASPLPYTADTIQINLDGETK